LLLIARAFSCTLEVMSLVPCPACSRHVRASDAACPFCAAPVDRAPIERASVGVAVGTRAQLFLGALTVAAVAAASAAGCSPPPHAVGPVYGSPAPRREHDADAATVAADAAPSAVPVAPSGAYGAPPSP